MYIEETEHLFVCCEKFICTFGAWDVSTCHVTFCRAIAAGVICVIYFLQEELIPAVAQHFAAQVWSMLPLKLFMLFTCGSKLVQIADFLFIIPLLIATISGCGGK
jgi:hypothetical protein